MTESGISSACAATRRPGRPVRRADLPAAPLDDLHPDYPGSALRGATVNRAQPAPAYDRASHAITKAMNDLCDQAGRITHAPARRTEAIVLEKTSSDEG